MTQSTTRFDHSRVDLDGFVAELKKIRAEIDQSLGPEDLAHLYRLERWGRICTVLGLVTAWIPNPLSAFALSLGRVTRWMLMHHIGHRGYDRVPGVPARYTSKVFARGWRRYLDWPDCFPPDAWRYEHMLHHSYTSEPKDPDVFDRSAAGLRKLPSPLRYAAVAFLALTWRMTYYAPKAVRTWHERSARRDESSSIHRPPGETEGRYWELWRDGYLPYALVHFVLLPALFVVLGPWAVVSALLNSIVAEMLTSLHTFIVIGPSHSGDDLVLFDDSPASRAEHVYRQVVASTNYRTGGDLSDWAHMWLNYQIEHHLWPDLPMLRYRQVQPRVQALCERYGVPYSQGGVFTRVRKMIDVVVGRATMPRIAKRTAASLEEAGTKGVSDERLSACETAT